MKTQQQIKDKWKDAVSAGNTGYLALPEVLLRRQAQLNISPTELTVLINILSFWWYEDKLPFPGNETIAKRMNVTTRTVQRAVGSLEKKGLIARKKEFLPDQKWRRSFDLSGLVMKLESYAAGIHLANESRSAA